ncbi:hypothetical protein [Micromonospora zingiberis]|uniref:hypothetical protein n=1 Tax=Micromonospora zingiberis TaxID=2053011 RepID=UPI0013F49B90|nr:hypothetical protein [Micromonospora zingiberis]
MRVAWFLCPTTLLPRRRARRRARHRARRHHPAPPPRGSAPDERATGGPAPARAGGRAAGVER